VIQDFQASVNDIAWIESHGLKYIVAGCDDGVVGMWQVLVDGDRCDVSLRWKTTKGELDMKDATIEDVQGLSQLNRKLLKQRGAVGEPSDRLREAGKKVATMVSVVSQLRTSSGMIGEGSALRSSGMVRELEQRFEQNFQAAKESLEQKFQEARDSFFEDVTAVVARNNMHG
jgi:hypothetical protein